MRHMRFRACGWNQGISARMVSLFLAGLLLVGGFAYVAPAHSQEACGELERGIGPYDYRTATQGQLDVVHNRHFTDRVRNLEGGESSYIGSDLTFTLHRFPNHHLALDAMARLVVREGTRQPRHSKYSIDCWFDRAIRFQPDDSMVWLVKGLFYFRLEELDTATEHLRKAVEIDPDNYQAHYNLGLVLTRAGRHEAAVPHAKQAYELGHPLPGLRNILEREGYSLAQ